MANPNPSHNPTDGLLSAVAIQLAGTNLVALKTVGTGKPYPGLYTVSLSLTSANGLSNAVTVTPSLVDVNNAAYGATAGSWVFRSFGNPPVTEASVDATQIAPKPTQTAKIASVGASGASTCAVTALAVGQCVVEFSYPTYDSAAGTVTLFKAAAAGANAAMPKDSLAVQLIVTVKP